MAGVAVEQLEAKGHEVRFHDLYREGFDPILVREEVPRRTVVPDVIRNHCREIAEAEGIIIIHPNWWGQPPAILKGWVDRVMRPGVAYEFAETASGEAVMNGLLKTRVVLVLNTSNTTAEEEERFFGNPLETIWRKCTFHVCGVTDVHIKTFGVVVTSSESRRKAWLGEVRSVVDELFPK
jgi:putative NADPH-quinone reductase